MRHAMILGSCLVLAFAGCSRQDTDKLARIGKTMGQQAEQSVAYLRENLKHSVPLAPLGLAARVQHRLSYDQRLQGAKITVEDGAGGVVEIKGKVADLIQRRRVIMLAETTVGVEKVKDAMIAEDGSQLTPGE